MSSDLQRVPSNRFSGPHSWSFLTSCPLPTWGLVLTMMVLAGSGEQPVWRLERPLQLLPAAPILCSTPGEGILSRPHVCGRQTPPGARGGG